jgi:photosystem II stability/assembly factor-like uncharacterized protein
MQTVNCLLLFLKLPKLLLMKINSYPMITVLVFLLVYVSACTADKSRLLSNASSSQSLAKPTTLISPATQITKTQAPTSGPEVSFIQGKIRKGSEIWGISYDSTLGKSVLYLSTDEGQSWKIGSVASIAFPSAIVFSNQDQDIWVGDEAGIIWHSTDNGKTWQKIWPNNKPVKGSVQALQFYQNIGYAVIAKTGIAGAQETPGIQVLKTIDNGKTWQVCRNDKTTVGLLNLTLWEDQVVVLALSEGEILLSEDGGKVWQLHPLTLPTHIVDLAFNKRGVLWGVGQNQGLFYSINNGKTWQKYDLLSVELQSKRWLSIDINEDDIGVCGAADGTLLFTQDGGKVWQAWKTTLHLEGFELAGDGVSVLVGKKFALFNKSGKIYHIKINNQ